MTIGTLAAGVVIVAITAALELSHKDFEERRKEFENSN